MTAVLFFTFIGSLAKGGLWIALGILIKNHRDALLALVTRKSLPDEMIEKRNLYKLNKTTKWIGIFAIIVGISLVLSAIATLFVGFGVPVNNIKFEL